jgi:hypothetical protein
VSTGIKVLANAFASAQNVSRREPSGASQGDDGDVKIRLRATTFALTDKVGMQSS